MFVYWHVTVFVVIALGFPIVFIAIVVPGIFAVLGRVRVAIRPDLRHVVGAFDPPAQPAYICQAGLALGFSRETNQFELDRGTPICLDCSGRMSQRGRGNFRVEMLVDGVVIDRKMRDIVTLSIRCKRAVRSRSFGGVMNDPERSRNVVAGAPG